MTISFKKIGTVLIPIVIIYLFLIGLGPIRRISKSIIPDILEPKVNINAVCDGFNKVYIFTADNGDVDVSIVIGGCPNNTNPPTVNR